MDSVIRYWAGETQDIFRARQPVLVGFPCDEGVRRNQRRVGAATAPEEIRHWLHRLTAWDAAEELDLGQLGLLDLGDVKETSNLEAAQEHLGEIIGAILTAGAVPIVLGGGHETAYGHFLGYVTAGLRLGIVNLDAHLDVRPLLDGRGHSGSPFRQVLEHPSGLLAEAGYVCLGAQPFSVSRDHLAYLGGRGVVCWRAQVSGRLVEQFGRQCTRLAGVAGRVYVSVDADVVRSSDVPGVSVSNPLGLSGDEVIECVRDAGADPAVSSLDIVEINPHHDVDGRSARWGALAVWHFLAGLAQRSTQHKQVR
jgi:formiminoglutamase